MYAIYLIRRERVFNGLLSLGLGPILRLFPGPFTVLAFSITVLLLSYQSQHYHSSADYILLYKCYCF